MQMVRLWYPYLSVQECEDLAALAPSTNVPAEEEPLPEVTWREEEIEVMKREFVAMDASGDGKVDQYVWPLLTINLHACLAGLVDLYCASPIIVLG
jgi:hypothetical protein